MAYTPGLKIKELALVKKTRRLHIPGSVLVKLGDIVSADTSIARTTILGEPIIINASDILSIDMEVEDLTDYILKKVGDTVDKGELIGKYSAFFGLIKKFCRSPVKGTIESISNITGQVILREPPKPVEVKAYIPGKIVNILQVAYQIGIQLLLLKALLQRRNPHLACLHSSLRSLAAV